MKKLSYILIHGAMYFSAGLIIEVVAYTWFKNIEKIMN